MSNHSVLRTGLGVEITTQNNRVRVVSVAGDPNLSADPFVLGAAPGSFALSPTDIYLRTVVGWELAGKDPATLLRWLSAYIVAEGVAPADITGNFYPKVYDSLALLTADHDPIVEVAPKWAVVKDPANPDFPKLYWLQFGGTTWQESDWSSASRPYKRPLNPLGTDNLVLNDGAMSGTTNWTHWMGPFGRIVQPGVIKGMHIHFGSGGNTHGWQIRKSSVVGPTAPAAFTYTNLLASGTQYVPFANTWQDVGVLLNIPVTTNEWIWFSSFQGLLCGQFSSLAPLEASGHTDSAFVEIKGGQYRSVGGTFPSGGIVNPTPTSSVLNSVYGACSVRIK